MAKYRKNLPQLSDNLFITDGGLETSLVFDYGLKLSNLGAFGLLQEDYGSQIIAEDARHYAAIAVKYEVGLILSSATWRGSKDTTKKLGYSRKELEKIHQKGINLLCGIRDEYENEKTLIVLAGEMGPRGDGYHPEHFMSEQEAEDYHHQQIEILAKTQADFISAMTVNYIEEAIGITKASASQQMPVAISLTVETNGKLPSGTTLKEAIEKIDAATNQTPIYYMINCAHPSHFQSILTNRESWVQRIRGIRANASRKSHAELDKSLTLDRGNPEELASLYYQLKTQLNHINIWGGCCGTNHTHIEAIANLFAVNKKAP